jgi:hypothetical protein
MQPTTLPSSRNVSNRIRVLAPTLALCGVGLLGGPAAAALGAKLPKQLTTPTGNFITLYAFSSSGQVASADVSICTSAHTPAGTEAIPFFFSLRLSNGSTIRLAEVSSKSPPLRVTPLGPKQCVRGWISFHLPKGSHPAALVYTYGKPIVWRLG